MDVTTIIFHTQITLNPKNSLKQILDLLQRLSKPTNVKTEKFVETNTSISEAQSNFVLIVMLQT
jgi:hypothetical protein